MNELHKYATFSVDLIGTPNKINSMFSMGRARIFYKGINRNRSIINGDVAEQLASTIPGTPVIGTYNYETNDFEGHEDNPSAYGFIPLNPNYKWVNFTDGDNQEREYLEVDVVIWDGRFEEAKEILSSEKALSMELNPATLKGTFERIGANTYYHITHAEFAGITVLGENVEPCFKDAKFITAYSNMVSAYALYVEDMAENNEGGKDIMENITEIVEPEVITEEVSEEAVAEETVVEEPAAEEVVETEETVEEVMEEATEEVEEPATDEAEEAEETETVEIVEETEFSDKSEEDADDKEAEDEDDKKEDDEEDDKNEEYTALVEELNDYKAKYESLENKYNEALNSLKEYTKKEKLEIINKFSTKIESEELIAKLTENADNYSIEEIKDELGRALIDQMSNEEDVAEETSEDANFSLNINITDNNLGNSAWDLVKRHKANK